MNTQEKEEIKKIARWEAIGVVLQTLMILSGIAFVFVMGMMVV